MVERPIKKSEQQARPTEAPPEAPENRQPRSERRPGKGRDPDNQGKGRNQRQERVQPSNPALARGPKPSKPQPISEETVPEDVEPIAATIADQPEAEVASPEQETVASVEDAAPETIPSEQEDQGSAT